MQTVKQILLSVQSDGFEGVYPLYIMPKGYWQDEYALFELEFEKNNEELSKEFFTYLENIIEGEVYQRDNEYEVIGYGYDDIDADRYWAFPLIEDIWL